MALSVVVPAYNEDRTLKMLHEIRKNADAVESRSLSKEV